jgi:hypothetical protein
MTIFKYITQLATGFFLISAAAQAQQGVCVYKDSDYDGPRRCFEDSVQNFARLGINDQISSFQIHGSVDVIFYQHRGFRGARKRFSTDQPILHNGKNDKFSSMKIVESHKQEQWGNRGQWGKYGGDYSDNDWHDNQDEDDNGYNNDNNGHNDDIGEDEIGRVCLYSDPNYRGKAYCFKNDDPRFENFGFDNKADSIRIEGDVEVELFQHADYKGFSRLYRQSMPRFKPGERDQYSAIRIRRRNNGQDYNHLTSKACLFPDRNYGGQPYCMNSDIPRFANFGFDNKADSLRITGNYEIILYQHENYTGYSRKFRNNIPRFQGKDHDQFSSIRIRPRSGN